MPAQTVSVSDIPNLNNQINDLQTQASGYKDKLNTSPTALAGSGDPTSLDISNQESLDRINKSIQALNDTKLRTQWYGPTDPTTPNPSGEGDTNPGLIGSTLNFLSKPLYGVVGAVKHFTGQGTNSLQQDVADNMQRNKSTFGDVLKTAGLPSVVSAPLGFALDIGMDPVNWLTMGESALIPRIGMGAYEGLKSGEGLIEGISTAAKSGLLEKANTIARYTPFLRKTELAASLGNKALTAADAYENLVGRTAADLVLQKGVGVGSFRIGLGDVLNKVADAIPGGQGVLKNFIYDPAEWVRQARIKDIVQSSLGTGVDLKGAVNAGLKGESIEPYLEEAKTQFAEKLESTPVGKVPFGIDLGASAGNMSTADVDKAISALQGTGLENKVAAIAPHIVNGVDDATSILKNPTPFVSADPMENALRLVNEKVGGAPITLDEIAKIVNSGALDATGVKWFDNMMGSMRDFKMTIGKNSNKAVEIGKNIMDKYDQAMGLFRVAKVGASPTAYTNAVVGNLLMTHMANGDVGPEFFGRLKQAWNLYRDKPGAAALLDDILMNAGGESDAIRTALQESKTAARGTFGDIGFLNAGKKSDSGANYIAERLLRAGRDGGFIDASITAQDIMPELKSAISEVSSVKDAKMASLIEETPMHAGTTQAREAYKTGKAMDRTNLGTGMLSNEMFNSNASAKMFEYIAEKAKAEPSNMAWKLLDFTLNKASSKYETIDQTYKMATFLRATVDGYTVDQLRQMRHLIDITPEEIQLGKYARNGQYRYRLSPNSALNLANVMYLNYNAMPSAVRVMRNFPLLGSPFVSFMYGMALKTGQTLAYNPSAFNKVNYALQEFSGSKTPLEKQALKGQFYSYLNQPGMYRMPFFDENPIYLNLSSMIPYYSLNMFQPNQASYAGTTTQQKIAQAVQSSPLLKDPVGSTLFNYLIQPLILGEATRPQGMFGQPLYPIDATGVQKLGYGARDLGEAFMPNAFSYAGLLTPEAAAPYIPSYRWRQLTEAKYGKNQLGISSKESPASHTIRAVLQASGVPVQTPVNTAFAQTNAGKQ